MVETTVLSLYDFTGYSVRPWAQTGYHCVCVDIEHQEEPRTEVFGKGSITYVKMDLWVESNVKSLVKKYPSVYFMSCFPVCTDLAVSGSKHFKKKAEEDPLFQSKAADYAKWCGELGDALGCRWYVENPVSRLSTLWRKPDYTFNPHEYGGYLENSEGEHPEWPEYIPPFDAYTKKTCVWSGGGFIMPEKRGVPPVDPGKSKLWSKLGGKSKKTKQIRSATPRGFAKAVFEANKG